MLPRSYTNGFYRKIEGKRRLNFYPIYQKYFATEFCKDKHVAFDEFFVYFGKTLILALVTLTARESKKIHSSRKKIENHTTRESRYRCDARSIGLCNFARTRRDEGRSEEGTNDVATRRRGCVDAASARVLKRDRREGKGTGRELAKRVCAAECRDFATTRSDKTFAAGVAEIEACTCPVRKGRISCLRSIPSYCRFSLSLSPPLFLFVLALSICSRSLPLSSSREIRVHLFPSLSRFSQKFVPSPNSLHHASSSSSPSGQNFAVLPTPVHNTSASPPTLFLSLYSFCRLSFSFSLRRSPPSASLRSPFGCARHNAISVDAHRKTP